MSAADPGPAESAMRARYAEILHGPRTTVWASGTVALIIIALALAMRNETAWRLVGLSAVAVVAGGLALWNVVNFSPSGMARLEALALSIGGRFVLWETGAGNNKGNIFTQGIAHQRFGLLKYAEQGTQIEIGHVATTLRAADHTSPMGRHVAYASIRLPERMPHVYARGAWRFQTLFLAWLPASWKSSQRMRLDGGRGVRVFVGGGGEAMARALLTPDLMRLIHRVARHYDVEIVDRTLYLYAARSVAAGTERRSRNQLALIGEVVSAMMASEVWERARAQNRGRGPEYALLRSDPGRRAAGIAAIAVVSVLLLSWVMLSAAGLLG